MKRKFHILVADDDIDDQDMIKSALKKTNEEFEVVPLYNGLQLLEYLLKKESYKHLEDTPDLIILDLNMPIMDGYEVLQVIRYDNVLNKIPVFILSTSWQENDKKKALELGAYGFYSKPMSVPELKKILEEVCSLAVSANPDKFQV